MRRKLAIKLLSISSALLDPKISTLSILNDLKKFMVAFEEFAIWEMRDIEEQDANEN